MPSERSMFILTKILMVMLGILLVVSALITVFPFVWSALLSTRDRS
ncbi:carbohydrate ABC transporter permease, partial [Vibrio sp. 10N.261.45.F1]